MVLLYVTPLLELVVFCDIEEVLLCGLLKSGGLKVPFGDATLSKKIESSPVPRYPC